MIGDAGYQGTGPITPHKRPPGGDLTAKQNAYNYSINRLRAAIERARWIAQIAQHGLISPSFVPPPPIRPCVI
jgi:hypothetical protein